MTWCLVSETNPDAGNLTMTSDYEAKNEPKAPKICEYCKENKPKMLRCGRCGENYCSAVRSRSF